MDAVNTPLPLWSHPLHLLTPSRPGHALCWGQAGLGGRGSSAACSHLPALATAISFPPRRSQIEAPFKPQLCAFCFQREVHLLCACKMDKTRGTFFLFPPLLPSLSQAGICLKAPTAAAGRCSGLRSVAILLLWHGKGWLFPKSRLSMWPAHGDGIPGVGGQAGPPAPCGKPVPFTLSEKMEKGGVSEFLPLAGRRCSPGAPKTPLGISTGWN